MDFIKSSVEVWNVGAQVGEGPFWDTESQTLYWIDVRAPALHQFSADGASLRRWSLPEPVGAYALLASGRTALLALKSGLALLDLPSGAVTAFLDPEPGMAGNRLNEGKVSPCGDYFVFGSMDDGPQKSATGALYCLSAGGRLQRLRSGLIVANGVAWSPDGARLYFSDSRAGVIWAAEWDAGTIAKPTILARLTEAQGRPDGAAVDVEGCYWSAGVSAGRLNRFSPDGVLIGSISLPVQAPTMPAFGGCEGDRLFVTSHRVLQNPLETDGAIIVLTSAIPGLGQRRFRMQEAG